MVFDYEGKAARYLLQRFVVIKCLHIIDIICTLFMTILVIFYGLILAFLQRFYWDFVCSGCCILFFKQPVFYRENVNLQRLNCIHFTDIKCTLC